MRKQLTVLMLGGSALLAGCGGGDDTPPPTSQVPASASATAGGFTAYLQALVASTSTDGLEPVDVSTVTPPGDDTSEPQVVD
jgi:hypothetical protein